MKLSHLNFVPLFALNQVKSKKKRSSLKFRPFFHPKSVEELKNKKKGLHSNFVPFFAQNQVKSKKKRSSFAFSPSSKPGRNARNIPFVQSNLMPNLQRGGPCLNFAHFSMQFCNSGDPKGGAVAQWPPPKYAPAY